MKKRKCTWLCKSYNQVVINQWGILKLNVLSAVKKDQIKLFEDKRNKTLKPEHGKQLQQQKKKKQKNKQEQQQQQQQQREHQRE